MIYACGGYELDLECRELRLRGVRAHVEPQVFDLLLHLISHRQRVVSKEELIRAVWGGRCVSDAALTSRINAARRAIGDSGKEQKFIRTVPRRGFRFIGDVREDPGEERAVGSNASPITPAPSSDALVGQQVRYCRTSDGVHLAFSSVGDGPPLVKTANWLNHLVLDWQSPIWSPLFRRLVAQHCFIRYDERGIGPMGTCCAGSRARRDPSE